MAEKVYVGSVKTIVPVTLPAADRFGTALMDFSDDFSVFDWGKMPDRIENKGAALCMMSAYLFERIESEVGFLTHYLGMLDAEGQKILSKDLKSPINRMKVLLANKPELGKKPYSADENGDNGYDYEAYNSTPLPRLVPLEFIYRNSLPTGSSVFRRLRSGELTLEELGLESFPEEGEKLPSTFLDLSTKLEPFDRYLSWEHGQYLAGLANYEVVDIKQQILVINNILKEEFMNAGMVNEDGKFEFVLGPSPLRKIVLADAVGTLDECRITYNGIQFSKEVARQFYRNNQPEWVEQIDAAKKTGQADWKRLVTIQPVSLPDELKAIISHMYTSAANALLNRKLFDDSPSLDEVVEEYTDYLQRAA